MHRRARPDRSKNIVTAPTAPTSPAPPTPPAEAGPTQTPCIDSPKRWRWFLCAALVTLVLVLYIASGGMLRTLLHFLLIQLCHGTSSGKVFYLLFFTIAVFLRLAVFRPASTPSPGDRRSVMLWAIALTSIGLASSLLSHVLYIWTYSLPVGWASWHWKNGINSVTSITHVHTSKAAIAGFCQAIGATKAHTHFDTGYVYLDVVPAWLTAIIGLSFVGAIVCWLIVAPRVIGIGSRHGVMPRAWVFALAGASLTKSILDGGPLAYDAVVAAATLVVLYHTASDNKPAMSRNTLILLGLSVLFWLALLVAIDPSSLMPQAQRAIYRAAIYAVILCSPSIIALRRASSNFPRWRVLSGALAAVITAFFLGQQVRVTLVPLWSESPQVWNSYGSQCQPSYEVNKPSVGRIDSLYRINGEDPFRARNASVAKRYPLPQPQGLLAETTILSADRASIPTQPVGVVSFRASQELESTDYPRLRLKVEFDPNSGPALFCPPERTMTQIDENERFVAYHLLDRAMRHAGFTRYILVPYGFYERNPALEPPATTTGPASTLLSPDTDR
jgi:hypothetical protein